MFVKIIIKAFLKTESAACNIKNPAFAGLNYFSIFSTMRSKSSRE